MKTIPDGNLDLHKVTEKTRKTMWVKCKRYFAHFVISIKDKGCLEQKLVMKYCCIYNTVKTYDKNTTKNEGENGSSVVRFSYYM